MPFDFIIHWDFKKRPNFQKMALKIVGICQFDEITIGTSKIYYGEIIYSFRSPSYHYVNAFFS